MFVGGGGIDMLRGRSDVVVARLLTDNIEHYPTLLSFTGWYAVARNGLATSRFVSLIEYDVDIRAGFVAGTLESLRDRSRIVGYVPFPLSHPMYLHATPWLSSALASVYGIDVAQLVRRHLAAEGRDEWTATSNASMATSSLHAFVDWFLPLSEVFRHDPIGAHVHERTIKVFCLLNGLDNFLLPDVLVHRQRRAHGIFALSQEEAARLAKAARPPGTPL